jgi:hypothetical protein
MEPCSRCGRTIAFGAIKDGDDQYCSTFCAGQASQDRLKNTVAAWQSAAAELQDLTTASPPWNVIAHGHQYDISSVQLKEWLVEGRLTGNDMVSRGGLPWAPIGSVPALTGPRLWAALDDAQRDYVSRFLPHQVLASGPPAQAGALSCPRCAGPAYGGRSGCMILLIILTFPIGLLFLLIKPTYRCAKCGFAFQP